MSSRVPKSYRDQKQFAPYRKPIVKRTNSKSSLFGKIKNLFKNETEEALPAPKQIRISSIPSVPGGFFNPNTSNVSINTSHIKKQDTEFDDTNDSISSNAKLASFFANKGDVPLSEMEMEGVLSLMKRANSTIGGNDNDNDDNSIVNGTINTEMEQSSILRNKKQRIASNASFKLPSFNPKYDNSMMSSKRNLSFASTTSTTRRVFDYSSMPSPYKTVVFRYKSAANAPSKQPHKPKVEKRVSSNKKLSNTASALMSLLDDNTSTEQLENARSATSLANPYSNELPKLRKQVKNIPIPKASAPVLLPLAEVIDNTEIIEVPVVKETRTKKPYIETKDSNSEQPSFKLYKPTRSSSLRSSVVAAEDITTEETPKESKTIENEEKIAPPTSSFSFSFGKPEKPFAAAPATDDIQTPSINLFGNNLQKKKEEEVKPEMKPAFSFVPIIAAPTKPDSITTVAAQKPSFNFGASRPVETTTTIFSKPEESSFAYKFEQPTSSNVDQTTIDDTKVETYKSLFAF